MRFGARLFQDGPRGTALRVLEACLWVRDVRERTEELPVVAVHTVAKRELRPLEEPAHGLLGDVDDVVAEASAVGPPLGVASENRHPVRVLRHRDGQVQAEHLSEPRAREVELRDAREQDCDEIVTARLGGPELVELVDDRSQDRLVVVLAEPTLLPRLEPVPRVLEAGRDDDLVDQRVG